MGWAADVGGGGGREAEGEGKRMRKSFSSIHE